MKKIFIMAGESSGDWLGAKLLHQLKAVLPNAEYHGIGGKKMEAEGFKSLFPMRELSLMGFAEILPHIPNLKRRMKETQAEIRRVKPDIVITIDSPGFNFRIVEQLQDMRPQTKFVHYVAPTVWAYKPHRAIKVNNWFDKLLCILPFEPPYFTNAEFIGHPSIEDGLDKGDAARFKTKYNIDDFICVMPGSRAGEVKRNLPILQEALSIIGKPAVYIVADNVTLPDNVLKVPNSEKADCFAACSAGIIKSGTSGLEFAFARKPYVVVFRANPISVWILRRMTKLRFANLINILADKEIVPELLQEKFTAKNIANAIRNVDRAEIDANIAKLSPESGSPSANAANIVLQLID
jgi:lipid-A-disaccharide synthase